MKNDYIQILKERLIELDQETTHVKCLLALQGENFHSKASSFNELSNNVATKQTKNIKRKKYQRGTDKIVYEACLYAGKNGKEFYRKDIEKLVDFSTGRISVILYQLHATKGVINIRRERRGAVPAIYSLKED